MDAWKGACLLSNSVLLADTLARPIMVVVRNRSEALGLPVVLKAAPSTIKALAGKTSVMNPALLAPILAPARP
jgi:hypothetical protein